MLIKAAQMFKCISSLINVTCFVLLRVSLHTKKSEGNTDCFIWSLLNDPTKSNQTFSFLRATHLCRLWGSGYRFHSVRGARSAVARSLPALHRVWPASSTDLLPPPGHATQALLSATLLQVLLTLQKIRVKLTLLFIFFLSIVMNTQNRCWVLIKCH